MDQTLTGLITHPPFVVDQGSRLCGSLRMDDLDLAVREDADNGHLPFMHDLELPVLLVVLGEQMLLGAADVDGAGVVHTDTSNHCFFEAVLLL